ncbi:MAG TPA: sigma-54-dependent Fis family transcriptional regulator [Planctomycetes bacterium]|nr:sigma-54-dependent Fis family transcriptional regulator [Planctomycetota bacterium]
MVDMQRSRHTQPAEPPGKAPRVLLLDANEFASEALATGLASADLEVHACKTLEELDERLANEEWEAVVADQETANLEDLRPILELLEPPALILLSAFGSIDDAVDAVRSGASDYLSKPVSIEQLRVALASALERRDLRAENSRLREDLDSRFELGQLKSRSPLMKRVFDTVRTIADTRATVLIQGESGTGKTILARSIHRHSSRAAHPFVEVNCGALPDNLLESELFGHVRGAFTGAIKDRSGKFEVAHTGTIFLDEIGCASMDLQVKLLRVLQDRELERLGESVTRVVDVRVIAASNLDLHREVAAGRFREDLYYRLNVLGLETPPLRERTGDVLLLAEFFLTQFADEYDRQVTAFSPAATRALAAHNWPGNVRELENSIERAVLLSTGSEIQTEVLPESLRGATGPSQLMASAPDPTSLSPLREALETTERELILRALQTLGGSRKATASALEVNRTTLFNKMKKYNLMDFAPEAADDPRP